VEPVLSTPASLGDPWGDCEEVFPGYMIVWWEIEKADEGRKNQVHIFVDELYRY